MKALRPLLGDHITIFHAQSAPRRIKERNINRDNHIFFQDRRAAWPKDRWFKLDDANTVDAGGQWPPESRSDFGTWRRDNLHWGG